MSLDTGLREGIINTTPFFSVGEQLIINARCEKNGYVEVEMVDILDDVWEGFSRSDGERLRTTTPIL